MTLGLYTVPAGAAVRRTPTLAPTDTVIDGPSAAITHLSGLAVARDGTGGLVYLKTVGGVAHVFVSELLNGHFQTPTELDAGLAGPSSEPVITAANGGRLAVAWVNGGEIYSTQQASAFTGLAAPAALAPGTSPAISMSTFGKAYLAYTAPGAGGTDVRVAYADGGPFSPVPGVLDASPGDGAGSGSGRPAVSAAGDGTAVVAWGERNHIFVRRVTGTTPSPAVYQADPGSFAGAGEVSATNPVIGADGNSSYVAVAFTETVASGSGTQTRVLFNQLVASRFTGATAVDGLQGSGSAAQPAAAPTEFGTGFVTAEQTSSNNVEALLLGQGASPLSVQQVNSLSQASAPDAVPATAGVISTFIAWQQDQGNGSPEIRLRYAPDGITLGGEQVLSSPTLGATNADLGLVAGGDLSGDAAVAWIQGSGDQTRIVSAQLWQTPGAFSPEFLSGYQRTVHPVLAWSPASELWGGPTYIVRVDGTVVAQTTATSVAVPAALSQGRHLWQVSAVNQDGGASTARSASVFVDTLAPVVSVRVTGQRHPHDLLTARISVRDTRGGIARRQASGAKSVTVRWSAHSRPGSRYTSTHIYAKRGTYVLVVTVTDRAGNRTVVKKRIKVTVPRKKKTKKKKVKHTSRLSAAATPIAGRP